MFCEVLIAPHLIFEDSLEELLDNIPFFLIIPIHNFLPEANLSLLLTLSQLILENILMCKWLLVQFSHDLSGYSKQDEVLIVVIIQSKEILACATDVTVDLKFA